MKKKLLSVIVVGVLLLQSCTMYRIKIAHHDNGDAFYFPQKRSVETFFEWRDVQPPFSEGSYTLDWARKQIEKDRYIQTKGIEYLKIK